MRSCFTAIDRVLIQKIKVSGGDGSLTIMEVKTSEVQISRILGLPIRDFYDLCREVQVLSGFQITVSDQSLDCIGSAVCQRRL